MKNKFLKEESVELCEEMTVVVEIRFVCVRLDFPFLYFREG